MDDREYQLKQRELDLYERWIELEERREVRISNTKKQNTNSQNDQLSREELNRKMDVGFGPKFGGKHK